MKIRQATARDAEAMAVLATHLTRKYVACEFPEDGASALLDSMSANGMREKMAADVVYHLAELDGVLAGLIGIKGRSHLYHLFVDEAYHRQGMGRALWQFASGEAGSKVFTVNASRYALPIYEKLGFVAQSPPQERNGVITVPMMCVLSARS